MFILLKYIFSYRQLDSHYCKDNYIEEPIRSLLCVCFFKERPGLCTVALCFQREIRTALRLTCHTLSMACLIMFL